MYEFYTDAGLQAALQACDPTAEAAPLPSFHPEAMARLQKVRHVCAPFACSTSCLQRQFYKLNATMI